MKKGRSGFGSVEAGLANFADWSLSQARGHLNSAYKAFSERDFGGAESSARETVKGIEAVEQLASGSDLDLPEEVVRELGELGAEAADLVELVQHQPRKRREEE